MQGPQTHPSGLVERPAPREALGMLEIPLVVTEDNVLPVPTTRPPPRGTGS